MVKGLRQNCWLVDSATNVHIYNDKRLMTEYTKKPTRVGESIADRISLGRKKVKIRLAKKDSSKDLMLTVINVFYLPNSASNLVSFGLLDNTKIYYHNKDQIFYDQST